MTVAELISKLTEYDPKLPVVASVYMEVPSEAGSDLGFMTDKEITSVTSLETRVVIEVN